MLKVNERLDKISAARADFNVRGMLAGSCFIQAFKDAFGNDPMDEDADETDSENSDNEAQTLGNEEDDDCGPVERGPLMNEVRLVARKG